MPLPFFMLVMSGNIFFAKVQTQKGKKILFGGRSTGVTFQALLRVAVRGMCGVFTGPEVLKGCGTES